DPASPTGTTPPERRRNRRARSGRPAFDPSRRPSPAPRHLTDARTRRRRSCPDRRAGVVGSVAGVTLGPLSILDLATVGRDETIADSFAGSVALAQLAERTDRKSTRLNSSHVKSSYA